MAKHKALLAKLSQAEASGEPLRLTEEENALLDKLQHDSLEDLDAQIFVERQIFSSARIEQQGDNQPKY